MGKLIYKGFAKLGEVGQSGGAIIAGRNLRRKDSRGNTWTRAGPDDPIYKEPVTIYKPPPEREPPKDEQEDG